MNVPGRSPTIDPQRAAPAGVLNGRHAVAAVAALLVVTGLLGAVSAAWGYGLFILAGLALASAALQMAVLGLTSFGSTDTLLARARWLARVGVVSYVLALAALTGHYGHETLAGRMEWHWVLFGPLVLAALVAVEWGVYRKMLRAGAPALLRYRAHLSRSQADPAAMRRTLWNDVIVHKSLWQVSRFRWLRHTLIFWGFGLMFITELAAVFVREAMPAFGWGDPWRTPGHPLRLAFDLVYDVTGLMMLMGCLLALIWRASVQNKAERKFSDTPMVVFLLVVVITGFLVEGSRLAQAPDTAHRAYSFVGYAFAQALNTLGWVSAELHRPLWVVHMVASCAFIGWLPATRLIHTCATPVGRLLHSQTGLLAAKKQAVLAGLMRQRTPHD